MAEGLLFSAAELIIETLSSAAVKEIGLLWGVNDEFEKLQRTLETIKAVLRDAEKNSYNNQVKKWLERLEDVVSKADDLLAEVTTEGLRRQVMPGKKNKVVKEVRTFLSSSNQVVFRWKTAHKIKDIRKTLDDIADDRKQLHLEESHEEIKSVGRVRETHSFILEKNVVGRKKDIHNVLDLLLRPDQNMTQQEKVSVLPIVGMGGLGKTMLAKLVFNDKSVHQHFQLKIWVCVADEDGNFVSTLLGNILKQLTHETIENLNLEKLQRKLQEILSGKRYLLVLDDVWNEDSSKWKDLKDLLTNFGEAGSRILVTTRSYTVARVTGTLKPYNLGILEGEESWSLFKKLAFKEEEEPTDPESLDIARSIVRKCGGVPLAITTIGGLVYSRGPDVDWQFFFDKGFLDILPKEGKHVLETLRLSYDCLPSQLKHCFSFCSLFPKDHKIEVQKLIKFWIAHDLIKSSNQSQSDLEDIGFEYFKVLCQRSFFQELEGDELNKVKTCKMHDLVHDLAKAVAGEKYAKLASPEESVHEKVHHLSFDFSFDSVEKVPCSLLQATRLRTILFPIQKSRWDKPKGIMGEAICEAIISNFKLLRILDLCALGIKTVPNSIGTLKHLKYLDLSANTQIQTLPTSISKLVNLQTLKLTACASLRELPKELNKLVKLRHVEFDLDKIAHFPRGVSQLTNLQTLSEFALSKDPRSCKIDELKGLNNLRGMLAISGLRGVMGTEAAILRQKEHLQSLQLSWSKENLRSSHHHDGDALTSTDQEKTLEDLQPHPNLRELTVNGYDGVMLSSWISSLTNLVKIELVNCSKCQELPSLDQLRCLEKMYLARLDALEYIWINDGNGSTSPTESLPSLRQLELSYLPNFRGWWRPNIDDWQGDQMFLPPCFPSLSTLIMCDCPKLTSMPLFPNVVELRLEYTCWKPFEHTSSMSVEHPQVSVTKVAKEASSSLSSPSFSAISTALPPLSKLRFLILDGNYKADLQYLPGWMKVLSSLQRLEIIGFPELKSLCPAIQYLTSLQELKMRNCEKLEVFDGDQIRWENLTNLYFQGLPKLVALPEGLQRASTLQHLAFCSCHNLTAIPDWISSLCSLQRLDFFNCSKMESLPGSISQLTSLQTLWIRGCPTLLRRCRRQTGEDWPKIKHIPHL